MTSPLQRLKILLELIEKDDPEEVARLIHDDDHFWTVFGMRRTWLFISDDFARRILESMSLIDPNTTELVYLVYHLTQCTMSTYERPILVDSQPHTAKEISRDHLLGQLQGLGMERMMDKVIQV